MRGPYSVFLVGTVALAEHKRSAAVLAGKLPQSPGAVAAAEGVGDAREVFVWLGFIRVVDEHVDVMEHGAPTRGLADILVVISKTDGR